MAGVAIRQRDNMRKGFTGGNNTVVTTLATIRRALEDAVEMARLARQPLVFADQGKSSGEMIKIRFADRLGGVHDDRNQCDRYQHPSRNNTSMPRKHIAHRNPLPCDTRRYRSIPRYVALLAHFNPNRNGSLLFSFMPCRGATEMASD